MPAASLIFQFVNYYGITDYTDKIVNGGFDATVVTLNSRVFDLSAYDFDPSQRK
jgi:predicted PolB exonuclease-like 3'-5' exonuclease